MWRRIPATTPGRRRALQLQAGATPLVHDPLADTNWRIVGVGDVNGDRKPDLIWQNVETGELGVWFMDGITKTGGRHLDPSVVQDRDWHIVGVR